MRHLDRYDLHLYGASLIAEDLPPYKGCGLNCPHPHNRTREERAAAAWLIGPDAPREDDGRYLLADGRTVDYATAHAALVRMLPLWEALAGVR